MNKKRTWKNLASIIVLAVLIVGTWVPVIADPDYWHNEPVSVMPIEVTGDFHSIREFQDGEDWVHEYLDAYGNVTAVTVFFGMTPQEHAEQYGERGEFQPGTAINRFNITVRAAVTSSGIVTENRSGVVRVTATMGNNAALTSLTAANEGSSGAWGAPGWSLQARNVSRSGITGTAQFFMVSAGLESSSVTISGSFEDGGRLGWFSWSAPHGGSASYLGWW